MTPAEFRKALELAAFGRDWLSPEQAEKVEELIAPILVRLDAFGPSEVPCFRCGELRPEFSVSNAAWNAIVRKDGPEQYGEYYCVQCFGDMAFALLREVQATAAQAREAGRREGLEEAKRHAQRRSDQAHETHKATDGREDLSGFRAWNKGACQGAADIVEEIESLLGGAEAGEKQERVCNEFEEVEADVIHCGKPLPCPEHGPKLLIEDHAFEPIRGSAVPQDRCDWIRGTSGYLMVHCDRPKAEHAR